MTIPMWWCAVLSSGREEWYGGKLGDVNGEWEFQCVSSGSGRAGSGMIEIDYATGRVSNRVCDRILMCRKGEADGSWDIDVIK